MLTLLDRTPQVVKNDLREVASITIGKRQSDGQLLHVTVQPGREAELVEVVHWHVYHNNVGVPANNPEPWCSIADLYYPRGASLLRCVLEFKATHVRYQDPLASRGACYPASHAFVKLLRDRKVYLGHTDVVGGEYGPDHHYFVQVGPLGIDWTARQFHPVAPVPFVFPIPPSCTDWRDIRRHHALALKARTQSTQEPS